MITLLLCLVCVLGLTLAIGFGVGLRLPTKRQTAREALIAADVSQVFKQLEQIDRYALWRTGVDRIEWVGDRQPPRWCEYRVNGRMYYEVEGSESPHRLVHRTSPGDGTFKGSCTFELGPGPDGIGTQLRVIQEGTVPNPLFRTFWRFFVVQGAELDQWVADLQRALAKAPE